MAMKIGTWLIAIGCVAALFGLTVLTAALRPSFDRTLLEVATCAFSLAMTLIAGGLYIKARTYPGTTAADSSDAKRGRKANCDRCGKLEPVIQCRVHEQHLCADCLGAHYDFRSCAYVPSTRRSGAKASAYSHASGA